MRGWSRDARARASSDRRRPDRPRGVSRGEAARRGRPRGGAGASRWGGAAVPSDAARLCGVLGLAGCSGVPNASTVGCCARHRGGAPGETRQPQDAQRGRRGRARPRRRHAAVACGCRRKHTMAAPAPSGGGDSITAHVESLGRRARPRPPLGTSSLGDAEVCVQSVSAWRPYRLGDASRTQRGPKSSPRERES